MKKAVSVFIMDVTDSSKFNDGQELSEYLTKWQLVLTNLNDTLKIIAKHRMGDEIICLVEGYSSAIMIANYIIYNWKYHKNMPYFGISCGLIEQDISNINIETWNHIIIKNARLANESIKEDKNRKRLIEFKPLTKFEDNEIEIINILLQLQSAVILEQTAKQRETLGLYSLIRSQKEIAGILNKSTSTISGHFTGGKTDLILEAAESMYNLLTLKEIQSIMENNSEDIDGVKSIQEHTKKFETALRNTFQSSIFG